MLELRLTTNTTLLFLGKIQILRERNSCSTGKLLTRQDRILNLNYKNPLIKKNRSGESRTLKTEGNERVRAEG